jgi:hypothetical protein
MIILIVDSFGSEANHRVSDWNDKELRIAVIIDDK